jgi:hypothetical protein
MAGFLAPGMALSLVGCGRENVVVKARQSSESEIAAVFQEVTEAWGLPAKGPRWPDGTYATPEVTAGGVALLDYDQDGRLDILQICHGPPSSG